MGSAQPCFAWRTSKQEKSLLGGGLLKFLSVAWQWLNEIPWIGSFHQ